MEATLISNPKEISKSSVKKSRRKKILLLFLAVLITISGTFIYWKYYYNYGDGNRTGLLQKFSHKGNFSKTYEGEMILSSIASSSNIAFAFEKFSFSVTSDSLAKQLDTLQGKMVIVHYQQKNGALSWRGDSEYLVDGVKCLP